MATDNTAPEKMTLDRADGSATIELYRAALGPVHVDYYLKAFTRFDAAGKAGPSWNWSAALVTLNWMAFRRLWGPALAYAGALTAALLFLFGILPLIFPLSQTGLWTLLALALLLAVGVPGAFGNAWLYAACNKAMDRAYSATATQEEACTRLQQRAAGRPRLGGLAAGNLALCAAVAAVVLSWPGSSTLPLGSSKMEHARLEAAGTLTPSAPAASTASAAATAIAAGPVVAASAAASAPAAPPAAAPLALASAPAAPVAAPAPAAVAAQAPGGNRPSRSSQGLVQSTAPSAAAISAAASASASAAPAPAKTVAVAAATEKADKIDKAEQRAAALAAEKAAKAERAARKADAAKTAKEAAATASAAADKAGAEKYLVNVGLFADANNARNAYTKLMDAGLPALSQELHSAKGERTRVRVGPFESRAEADAAAEKIRALQLEALVSRQ